MSLFPAVGVFVLLYFWIDKETSFKERERVRVIILTVEDTDRQTSSKVVIFDGFFFVFFVFLFRFSFWWKVLEGWRFRHFPARHHVGSLRGPTSLLFDPRH